MKKLLIVSTIAYVISLGLLAATLYERGRIVEVQSRIIDVDHQIIEVQRANLRRLEDAAIALLKALGPVKPVDQADRF